MSKESSFRLATALLGLLILVLPFSGLPANLKTVLFVSFGLLTILFSLAGTGEIATRAEVNKNEIGEKSSSE